MKVCAYRHVPGYSAYDHYAPEIIRLAETIMGARTRAAMETAIRRATTAALPRPGIGPRIDVVRGVRMLTTRDRATIEETERTTAMPDPITGFRWTFQRDPGGCIDVIGVCDRHQWASRPVPYGDAVPSCPICQEQDGRIRFAALIRKERVS